MAYATRPSAPPEHSVEITRNAKGVAQFGVTVRGHDLDAVLQEARSAFVSLEGQFPYPDANGGAT
jgi:hypothetical protein